MSRDSTNGPLPMDIFLFSPFGMVYLLLVGCQYNNCLGSWRCFVAWLGLAYVILLRIVLLEILHVRTLSLSWAGLIDVLFIWSSPHQHFPVVTPHGMATWLSFWGYIGPFCESAKGLAGHSSRCLLGDPDICGYKALETVKIGEQSLGKG